MPIDPLDHSVTEALRAWRVQHSAGIDVTQTLTQCAQLCHDDVARRAFQNAAQRATGGEGHTGMLDALRPALNEAESLPMLLPHLLPSEVAEVILADGGSSEDRKSTRLNSSHRT